jgi:hypothetical protein
MWEADRLPAFWETWKGSEYGSLYKVLGVEGGRVQFLVMWQCNPYWQERHPPGSLVDWPVKGFLALTEYAPEWND